MNDEQTSDQNSADAAESQAGRRAAPEATPVEARPAETIPADSVPSGATSTEAEPAQPQQVMTDEELAAESARGRTVGLVAVVSVGLFTAFILTSYLTTRGLPRGNSGDYYAKYLAAIHERKLTYVLSSFCFSIATLLVGVVLSHLLFAVRQRAPKVPKFPLYMAVGGPVLVALIYPIYTIATVSAADEFVAGAVRTQAVAKDLATGSFIQITQNIWLVAQVMLTIAWVATGMFSMRTGLLTRMVGVFAIAIGAANFVAPPFAALLQIFGLGAIALLLLADSGNVPPAWKLGRPVPWAEVDALRAAGELPEQKT